VIKENFDSSASGSKLPEELVRGVEVGGVGFELFFFRVLQSAYHVALPLV